MEKIRPIINGQTDQYWTARAAQFDNLDWVNNDLLLAAMAQCIALIVPTMKIMDIGTGTAKVLKGLYALYPECEFAGIDICPNMLKKIDVAYGFKLYQRNVYDMWGIESDYYDVVTARMIFHHLFKPQAALQEIKRILRPGGQCVICEGVPPAEEVREWYTEMFKYKEERVTLTADDLSASLREAGFNDITVDMVMLREQSITNWLKNVCLDAEASQTIMQMHYEAPAHVKKAYDMQFVDNDIFMDWKFAVVSGKL